MKTRLLFAAILLATILFLPLGIKAQTPLGNWIWEGEPEENKWGTSIETIFVRLRLGKDGTFRFSHGVKELFTTHKDSFSVEAWKKGTYKIDGNKIYLSFSDDPIEFTTQRNFPDNIGKNLREILNDGIRNVEKQLKESTADLANNGVTKRNSFLICENTLTRLVLKWPIPEKEDDNAHVFDMIKDISK